MAASTVLIHPQESAQLLMIKRSRAMDFAQGAFVFPGGSVQSEDGNSPEPIKAAAIRELEEEVGVKLDGIDKLVAFTRWITPKEIKKRFDTHFFLAPMPIGQEITIQLGEVEEYRWLAPQEALSNPEIKLVYATEEILKDLSQVGDLKVYRERAKKLKSIAIVKPQITQVGDSWIITH